MQIIHERANEDNISFFVLQNSARHVRNGKDFIYIHQKGKFCAIQFSSKAFVIASKGRKAFRASFSRE